MLSFEVVHNSQCILGNFDLYSALMLASNKEQVTESCCLLPKSIPFIQMPPRANMVDG